MPISNQEAWSTWVESNKDSYGEACVNVARRVMELLDKEDKFDTHEIICRADKETKMGGITGFMAGAVAQMVSECHSRGEEFRRMWNCEVQIGTEGDKANKTGGVLNPALLTIQTKD
jgi:hypothetical protein